MASTLQTETGAANDCIRFHLSLNVDDLERSVTFYRVLFDVAAAKHLRDYAKFELNQPPLVLSLEPNRAPAGGKLNHLGFRLQGSEALVDMQRRLESQGHSTTREDGVECCYARQTKFWIADPDGNLWEMYTLEEDLDHRGPGQVPRPPAQVFNIGPAPSLSAHRLGEPLPSKILSETGGVDEVLLQGTFNAMLSSDERRAVLSEVIRVLKPGGQLTLHQLTARTALTQLHARLPGPAAAVEAIPSASDLVADLESAGFVYLQFVKLGEGPCFEADGVECRETRLVGYKPQPAPAEEVHEVLYKGPARSLTDDAGHTFLRGAWTKVDEATFERLRSGALADHFLLSMVDCARA